MMAELTFTGETVLLWLALVLAAFFLGVLVLDRVTRGGRSRHHHHEPAGLGSRLRRRFRRMRALYSELKEMFRERYRRRQERRRRHRRTP